MEKNVLHDIRLKMEFLLLCAMLVLSVSPAYAQRNRTIHGIVVDENKEPLPAAHVKQVNDDPKGSIAAIITDIQGHFTLTLPYGTKEIEASYLGYTSQRIKLTATNDYYIALQPSTELLDEVVVTGYQTISKERATGAFSKVDAKKLETQRLSDMGSMLEGRVAGYSDGKIRGVTSMNGLTTPLYVIDGFPVEKTTNDGYGNWIESVPDLNMEDIESITVLKDAAATSIYGARAANGVVVITTKRAKKDELNVSFSATLTVQPYDTYADKYLAGSSTMVELEREWARQNPHLSGDNVQSYAQTVLDNMSYSSLGIRNILNYYAGHISRDQMESNLTNLASQGYRYYRDIEKYGKRNPFSQQYNLNIGKGTEKNTFNASVSYRNNQLEDKYSENRTIGINLQNSTKMTSWLTLDVGTYLNYGKGTTQSFNLFSPGYTYMPYNGLVNGDGTYYTNTEEERYSLYNLNLLHNNGLYNLDITPLDEIKMNQTKNRDFSNRTFARLIFKFTDWLKYTASFQYEYAEYKTEQLKSKDSYEVRNKVNTFSTSNNDGTSTFALPYGNIFFTSSNTTHAYNFRQQLDFNKTFADVHDVTMILGTETRENKLEYNDRTLYNYDPQLLTYSLIDAGALSNFRGQWGYASFGQQNFAYIRELINRYVSVYSNAAYTYDGKYMVSGSIRWDKTNLFSTGSKYQKRPIWSVGAGWNVDREKFFHVSWVNMLKLRASYGIGGNIAKNSAPYMIAYYSNNNQVGGIQGTISSRPNPNLRWEKTTTLNVGVDFALLGNRLNGSIEYYNKRGTDLLANTNGVPTEGWGYSTYSINNGKMTNQGFELTLSGDVIRNNDWNWNISGVLGYNKNKVTYINVEAPVSYLVIDYPTAYPRVGNPYNAIYGYQWAGLSETGTPQVYDAKGNLYTDMTPPEIEDLVYLGTTVPVYNGSINTNLRWKNWELAAQFLFEGGHKMRNTNVAFISSGMGVVSKDIENRWREPGDEAYTDVPRYISSESELYNYNYQSMYANSSINVIDATNWRLRNLSLTYRIPASVCHKLYLKNARIMLGMENVFMVAKSSNAKYLLGGYTKPNYPCGVYLNF